MSSQIVRVHFSELAWDRWSDNLFSNGFVKHMFVRRIFDIKAIWERASRRKTYPVHPPRAPDFMGWRRDGSVKLDLQLTAFVLQTRGSHIRLSEVRSSVLTVRSPCVRSTTPLSDMVDRTSSWRRHTHTQVSMNTESECFVVCSRK